MTIAGLEPTVRNNQVSEPVTGRDKLGRSDFLKMFITQMQHQDPLNPMEGAEFTTQLAQFSSLEQLFNINENTGDILESQESLGRMQALDLIGKEILTEGNGLTLQENAPVQGFFQLPEAVSVCRVSIYDLEGNPIRTIDLGSLNPGENDFRWDGLDGSGKTQPAGTYTYHIWAKNLAGEDVEAETRTSGAVTGVKLGDLIPRLYLGEIEVPLTQVLEVRNLQATSPGDSDQT